MKTIPLSEWISSIHLWYPGFLKVVECSKHFFHQIPEILLLQQRFYLMVHQSNNLKTGSYTFSDVETFKKYCLKHLPEPDVLFVAGMYNLLKDKSVDLINFDFNTNSLHMGIMTVIDSDSSLFLTLYAYNLVDLTDRMSSVMHYRIACEIPSVTNFSIMHIVELSNGMISVYDPATHERIIVNLKYDDSVDESGVVKVLSENFESLILNYNTSIQTPYFVEYIPGQDNKTTFLSHLKEIKQVVLQSVKLRQYFVEEVLKKCQNVAISKDS